MRCCFRAREKEKCVGIRTIGGDVVVLHGPRERVRGGVRLVEGALRSAIEGGEIKSRDVSTVAHLFLAALFEARR